MASLKDLVSNLFNQGGAKVQQSVNPILSRLGPSQGQQQLLTPIKSFGQTVYNNTAPLGTAAGYGLREAIYKPFGLADSQLMARQQATNLKLASNPRYTPQMQQRLYNEVPNMMRQQAQYAQQLRSKAPSSAAKSALTVVGAGAPVQMGAGAVLGGGINALAAKFQGQNPLLAFGEGAANSLPYAGVSRITAPIWNGVTAQVAGKASPLAQRAVNAVVQAGGNIAENYATTPLLEGRMPTLQENLIAGAAGAGFGALEPTKDLAKSRLGKGVAASQPTFKSQLETLASYQPRVKGQYSNIDEQSLAAQVVLGKRKFPKNPSDNFIGLFNYMQKTLSDEENGVLVPKADPSKGWTRKKVGGYINLSGKPVGISAKVGGEAPKVPVITEEEYLIKNEATADWGDPALQHNKNGKDASWKRALDRQLSQAEVLQEKRDFLRKQYQELLKNGKLREPTRTERLIRTAQGNPDNQSVQSARNLLKKQGIAWEGVPTYDKTPISKVADPLEALKADGWKIKDVAYGKETGGLFEKSLKNGDRLRIYKNPLGEYSLSYDKRFIDDGRRFKKGAVGYDTNYLDGKYQSISDAKAALDNYLKNIGVDNTKIVRTKKVDPVREFFGDQAVIEKVPSQPTTPTTPTVTAQTATPPTFTFKTDSTGLQDVTTPSGKKIRIETQATLKPRTQLLKQADALLNEGSQKLEAEKFRAEQVKAELESYSPNMLQTINDLKRYAKSKAFVEGDIETLRSNTPPGMVDKVVEAVREAKMNENIPDSEALDIALSLPSKADAKIKLPTEILDARQLKREAASVKDLVYNSETDPKAIKMAARTQNKAQADSFAAELDEYQKALFKQTGATKRTKDMEGALVSSINQKMRDLKPAEKVNLLDYLRTPDRVLKKIGLGNAGEQLKRSYTNYVEQLPKELETVNNWYKQVKDIPNASQNIFKYMDGQGATLSPKELKVAGEMQDYLSQWASKLGLPKDKRVAHYITHIFEDNFIQKEFDPDVADLIRDKVPGSVYDPFLQQRLGKQGYVEDAFKAMDAYVKRATRKYNMDPALEQLKVASEGMEDSAFRYVKALGDRVNMRPTNLDNLLDNFIKSSPVGYKLGQRPTARVSRQIRQTIYRGTLGLNVGSAIRNLTQGANTYAQLGEVNTAKGYMKAAKALVSGDDELVRSGVLADSFIQDRNLSSYKKFWEKLDKGLFVFFDLAEKINRGAAYYGAKSKALAEGASESEAMRAGVEMARKTQFTFGAVDTPVAIQSDLVKLATQFQSYNLKQAEFLTEMAKNKEFKGMIRWTAANAALLFTIGQVMGWDWKDFVPFGGVLEGQSPIGGSPLFTLAGDATKIATGTPDKYGNPIPVTQLAKDAVPFIPAGVQAQKTIGGLMDVNKGYSESAKGRVKFPISQTAGNYLTAGALGTSKLKVARDYRENKQTVLGEKQSSQLKSLSANQQQGYYQSVLDQREVNKQIEAAKVTVLQTGKPQQIGDTLIYTKDGEVKTKNIGKKTTSSNGKIKAPKIKKAKIKRAKKPKKITLKAPKVKKVKLAKLKILKAKQPKKLKLKAYKPKRITI